MDGKIDVSRWLQGGYSDKKIAHTPDVVDSIITASLEKMQQVMGLKASQVVRRSRIVQLTWTSISEFSDIASGPNMLSDLSSRRTVQ